MFNKIQPQQINLHKFSSDSGHFSFNQSEAEVKANLNSGLTGDFNVEGSLYINRGKVQFAHPTNTLGGTAVVIGAGQSHYASGTNSAILGGASNSVSGTRNVILNSNSSQITDDVSDGTVLAGYGALITNGHNGAVILADSRVETKSSLAQNNLKVDFENGVNFENKVDVKNQLHVGGSGLFSGDFNVLGTMYYTGSEVASQKYVTDYTSGMSGILFTGTQNTGSALYSKLQSTGQSLDLRLKYDISTDNILRRTGIQTLSGTKQFYENLKMNKEVFMAGTGSSFNVIGLERDSGINISTGSSILLSSQDSIINLLATNGNNSALSENNFTSINGKWNSSFTVATGNANANSGHVVFGVHPSGIGWFKDTIILNNPSYIPATTGDAGQAGQFAWDVTGSNSQSGVLYLHNGNNWTRSQFRPWPEPVVVSQKSSAGFYVTSAAASDAITATTYLNALSNATVADGGETTSDWTIDTANGRTTYTGTDTIRVTVIATISATSSQSNEVVRFRMAKNGTTIAKTEQSRKIGTGTDVGALALSAIIEVAENDYIELHTTLDTSTSDTVTVENCNFSIVEF